MTTRATRYRLVAFVVMAVLGVTYGAIEFVNLPRLFGIGRYALTLELPESAGLYENGVVAVRGVPVGQVERVRLGARGPVAEIQIDDGVAVPRSAAIEVRSTSAVGEQYVNFAPESDAGPYYAEGDVVERARVVVPVSTSTVLERANELVASVPVDRLNRTVDEFSAAFTGTGDDLARMLDSGRALQETAAANLDPTRALLRDLVPVLRTQQATADQVRSWAHDLAGFTQELQDGDARIRGAFDRLPGFLGETSGFLEDVRPDLSLLLADLSSSGEVLRVYLPHVRQTVTILSATVNSIIHVVQGSPIPGTSLINFRAVVNSPPACTEGFQQERRSPSDLSPALPGTENFCDVEPDSPLAVRGARNFDCPDLSPRPDGRSNTARGCGLDFQSPAEAAAATEAAIRTQMEVAARNPQSAIEDGDQPPGTDNDDPNGPPEEILSYDPGTGGFLPPGADRPMILGNVVSGEPASWQDLLLAPLGLPR